MTISFASWSKPFAFAFSQFQTVVQSRFNVSPYTKPAATLSVCKQNAPFNFEGLYSWRYYSREGKLLPPTSGEQPRPQGLWVGRSKMAARLSGEATRNYQSGSSPFSSRSCRSCLRLRFRQLRRIEGLVVCQSF